MPNSAVKSLRANDTSSQDAGKSVAARSAKCISLSSHHHLPNSKLIRTAPPQAGLFAFALQSKPIRKSPAVRLSHTKRNAGRYDAQCRKGTSSGRCLPEAAKGVIRRRSHARATRVTPISPYLNGQAQQAGKGGGNAPERRSGVPLPIPANGGSPTVTTPTNRARGCHCTAALHGAASAVSIHGPAALITMRGRTA